MRLKHKYVTICVLFQSDKFLLVRSAFFLSQRKNPFLKLLNQIILTNYPFDFSNRGRFVRLIKMSLVEIFKVLFKCFECIRYRHMYTTVNLDTIPMNTSLLNGTCEQIKLPLLRLT